MASLSSKNDQKKKRVRDSSPHPMPEKYKIYGITQEAWNIGNSSMFGSEDHMIEIHNKDIKRCEEQNKNSEKKISEFQDRIGQRNTMIEEFRQKILNIYKQIEDGVYVSKPEDE
ncbi:hypothetical protein CTI12_AA375360 [Artemisia annua]|uniref:Uncharacterized protein n=1 Tax=Artemisia annua TaxID=35608 RepID=A0A2U1MHV3_ARTAN|nr:hypothetical protein CTI12_AA375360 [Artemisia annua]